MTAPLQNNGPVLIGKNDSITHPWHYNWIIDDVRYHAGQPLAFLAADATGRNLGCSDVRRAKVTDIETADLRLVPPFHRARNKPPIGARKGASFILISRECPKMHEALT
jgi:hypothetical protein